MPSSIWTGAISFGLVQVPVRIVDRDQQQGRELQPARGRHRLAHPLPQGVREDRRRGHARTRSCAATRSRRASTCVIEADEIESLRPKGTHAIEIEEFVDLDEIDPLYFEQPYYLVPDARGVKPYKLLVDAMAD